MENESILEAQELNQRALLLIEAGNLSASEAQLNHAIECDPMLMDSYKNLGNLKMKAEDFDSAKTNYKKALLIRKDPELYYLYGNACMMSDDLHEGLKYYNLAVSSGYDSDEMLFFMGLAYDHLNDPQMALRYFQKACYKNPSRPEFLVQKIRTLFSLNLTDAAEEAVDQLLLIAPELFDGYHLKTRLLAESGRIDEACAFSAKAADRFPEDAALLYDYIECISHSGDLTQALSKLDQAKQMKYYADYQSAFCIMEAKIAADLQDYPRAMRACKESIALEDADHFAGESRFLLMNLLLAQKNYEEILSIADTLIQKKQNDIYYFSAVYYRPFCQKQLGHDAEAQAGFQEAESLFRLETLKNPRAIELYLYRALCLKELEQYDKAIDLLDFLEKIAENVIEVYAIKADVYDLMGKHILAEEARQKAYAIRPELKSE